MYLLYLFIASLRSHIRFLRFIFFYFSPFIRSLLSLSFSLLSGGWVSSAPTRSTSTTPQPQALFSHRSQDWIIHAGNYHTELYFHKCAGKKCRLKFLIYRLRWELRLCHEVLTNMLTKMLTTRANADYCLQDGKMEVRALRTIHPEEEVCLYLFRWCWYFSWCWRLWRLVKM